MAIRILMPALSPTMTEGTLLRWHVKEGDEVASGDVVAEIETDKATMEVESVDEGVVGRLCVEAGSEGVAVNSVIAVLREEGEGEDAVDAILKGTEKKAVVKAGEKEEKKAVVEEGEKEAKRVEGEGMGGGGRKKISPLAKKLAREHDLDMFQIEGSGPRGRIIKRDIERVLAEGGTVKVVAGETRVEGRKDLLFPNSVLVPHTNMRKVIASRLTESKQTIPHFYLSMDVKIDNLLSWRAKMNEMGGGEYKISVNDIIVKAVSHALMKEDKANAGWTDEGVRYFESADVAVAVAIEGGLVTPVVRDAQNLGLVELSGVVKDLVMRAREGKLSPEEYQGGTFSVSNLGMFGIDHFQAVINPPQACILAVGQGRETVVFCGDEVVKERVMTLTLSVDHRVVDGAVGAKYLSVLKSFLESPAMMLL